MISCIAVSSSTALLGCITSVNPEWGNTAQYVTRVVVPKGTVIYEGTAAPQIINDGTGYLTGGGNQVYIPEVNPSWFVN